MTECFAWLMSAGNNDIMGLMTSVMILQDAKKKTLPRMSMMIVTRTNAIPSDLTDPNIGRCYSKMMVYGVCMDL